MTKRVEMFLEEPSVSSVLERLDVPERLARRVLDELAFCMKTGTRLGRVIVAECEDGPQWWGHPHEPAYQRLTEFVAAIEADENADVAAPPETDLLTKEHFRGTVAERLQLPAVIVEGVIGEFFNQLTELSDDGVEVRTPSTWLNLESVLEAELEADLSVLSPLGYDLTLHRRQHRFSNGRRADMVCRDSNGDWVIVELKRHGADDAVVAQVDDYIELAIQALAGPGESVTGLILTDGASTEFYDAVRDNPRISQLNLRALDLPSCRAQRWLITEADKPVGWFAVAADGFTIVNGGGPQFSPMACALTLMEYPLDWERQRLRPLPVGDRSTHDTL